MPNAEEIKKSDKTVAVNVKLMPMNNSEQPVSANFTTVGVAQGIAYLDFGFIEPSQLAKVVNQAKNGNGNGAPVQENMNGKLVVRAAIGLDVLQRLQQQLTQVLGGLRNGRATRSSKE